MMAIKLVSEKRMNSSNWHQETSHNFAKSGESETFLNIKNNFKKEQGLNLNKKYVEGIRINISKGTFIYSQNHCPVRELKSDVI